MGRWPLGLWCAALAGAAGGLAACGAKSSLEAADPCAPSTEICDGVDNDCDGAVDEDIAPVTCGSHGCEQTVHCEDGVLPSCVPKEPSPEICNLQDDDCDGEVDEGFGFGPVGEVVTLRSTEGEAGSCTSCRWAWGSTLAPIDDGFLALWNLGLSGGNEQPTLFGRRLDGAGAPVGPVELLRPDFLLEIRPMKALAPLPPAGLPIEAEVRSFKGDVGGVLLADRDGATSLVSPIDGAGPRGIPRTVWTGERFVTAWEEDDELRVEVLDANGAFDKAVAVDPLERPATITLAVHPGRVAILVSRYIAEPESREQWFIGLDAFGNVEFPAREIDVEYVSWQRLVGTDEGWLHVRANGYLEPSTRQALAPDGTPLGPAQPFDDQRSLVDSGAADLFLPRPGLGEMVTAWQDAGGGDMHVELLDAEGDVLRGWSGPLPNDPDQPMGWLTTPHATLTPDRILVTWVGLSNDATPNPVRLRAFGCVE